MTIWFQLRGFGAVAPAWLFGPAGGGSGTLSGAGPGANVFTERALRFLGLLLGPRWRKHRAFRDRPTGNTLTEMLP